MHRRYQGTCDRGHSFAKISHGVIRAPDRRSTARESACSSAGYGRLCMSHNRPPVRFFRPHSRSFRKAGLRADRHRGVREICREEIECVAGADFVAASRRGRWVCRERRAWRIEPECLLSGVLLDGARSSAQCRVDAGTTRCHLGPVLQADLGPQQQSALDHADEHREESRRGQREFHRCRTLAISPYLRKSH